MSLLAELGLSPDPSTPCDPGPPPPPPRPPRRGRGRRAIALFALGAAFAAFVATSVPGNPSSSWVSDTASPLALAQPAATAGGGGSSAMTLAGSGPNADLKVTVSQTRDLISQTVTVSWTGGAATRPDTGQFGVNYLQIMQCWGDDPNGPDRTQCQYGGSITQSSPVAGTYIRSRQVNYGPTLIDQAETYLPGDDPSTPEDETGDNVFVPFWAVGHDRPQRKAKTNRSDFFDAQITNEVPLARTRGDGTGVEYFEIQTVRQAAGLGCGDPVTSGGVTTGRSCWLVVVPRNDAEVDGTVRTGNGNNTLDSSPLSQTNWAHRIVVPLRFLPVGQSCSIGSAERRLLGHEVAVEAVGRWQPALCAGGGTLFGYTQVSDLVARRQLLESTEPGMVMMTDPVPPGEVLQSRPLVYAPIAVSGLSIGFFIERQAGPLPTPAHELVDGLRFFELKLNQRLVAKLLTQSYRSAVVGSADYLKDNPFGLTTDPEFLQLNPEYDDLQQWTVVPDALVSLTTADVTELLWRWVVSDADARAFLAGTPDPWKMVINPNNRDIDLPAPSYPRNDQLCFGDGTPFRVCTLDAHPFANDMHEAGRAASRGDTLGRTASGVPNDDGTPRLSKLDRQTPGRRGVLAVVDTAIAQRYGLPTAALRNGVGDYVVPTADALLTAVGAMHDGDVRGVLAPNPAGATKGAYPLTTVSYAVTTPPLLDSAAGHDYAAFLRYAAGNGQQPGLAPGQLPIGYAPLPQRLRDQTLAAATQIEQQAGKPPNQPSPPAVVAPGAVAPGAVVAVVPGALGGTPAGSDGGGSSGSGSSGQAGGGSAQGQQSPPPPAASAPPTTVAPQHVAQSSSTPGAAVGAVRHLLIWLLIGGAAALLAAVLIRLFGNLRASRTESEGEVRRELGPATGPPIDFSPPG